MSFPENIEAEMCVIAAMLIEEAAIEKASSLLTAADFTRAEHVLLFNAAKSMHERGQPVDVITLTDEMRGAGQLDGAGGLLYVTGMFDHLPTAANVEAYAKIVRKHSLRRQLMHLGERLQSSAQSGESDAIALLTQTSTDLEQILARQSPAVVDSAITPRKPFSETVITFRDIPPPPLELPYLFGPYLNDGAAHWLTGKTGIGKSTWLYNVLPALATGTELWGIPTKPTRILYLDMESGELGRSMKAERLFPDRANDERMENLFIQPEPPRFPADLPALLAFVQEKAINLVVFDTARRVFSVKDENDNSEFYQKVVPILDAFKARGIATLTMGHPAKNGSDGSSRGAGAQDDAGDVNLSLMMHRSEIRDKNGVIALHVAKNRILGNDHPPLLLRRIGKDRFQRLSNEEESAMPTGAEEDVPKKAPRSTKSARIQSSFS
jgi:hypothetical protein